MPKQALEVSMTLQGVERVTINDPANFTWRLKIKCTHCNTEHSKNVFVCENEKEDKNVKSGTSETNLNFTCPNCKRQSTLDIVSGSFKEISGSEKFFPMIQFDGRGIEVVKWEPEGNEGLVAYNSEGTSFEVNLENGEYYDYDEDTEQEISVTNIKTRLGK
ncbi:hypothetical protein C9374_013561 [Naegleria lovaniensis]|uniref:Uncharacterized protein n=1 Tax=Naegleria lovaniensis TaxID=51637 RepID=A0AA88KQ29_NAELO|nr:uncharacterized protein C9374_013561 [Naegleria lovaniensis]KAG2392076.1 hypothetical protein C9374_013561 [Naegleria lovaniensis]